MSLDDLGRDWETLARHDPLWAVYVRADAKGGQWDVDEFLQTGTDEIGRSRRLLERHGRRLHGTILDFGCGVGRLSRALSFDADRVIGVDIAPTMLARAREMCADRPNIDFVLNDAPTLPFSSGSVNVVYTSLVLQHMPRPLALGYYEEFLRVLRPDGIAVVQVASRPQLSPKGLAFRLLPAWAYAVLQRKVLAYPAAMRMQAIDVAQLARIAERHGAELLATEVDRTYGGHWDYERVVIAATASTASSFAGRTDA